MEKLSILGAAILLVGCDALVGYDDLVPSTVGGGAPSGGAGGGNTDGGGGTGAEAGNGGAGGVAGGGGIGGSGGSEACDDGTQNGDETDVDCGGGCDPCDNDQMCSVDGDCITGSCDTTCRPWLDVYAGGGATVTVHDVATDSAGNVIAVGRLQGSAMIGGTTYNSNGGSEDILIVKHLPDGTVDWVKLVGGAADFDILHAVTVDANDNIIVAGHCRVGCDFGNGPVGSTADDWVAAKLTPTGDEIWAVGNDSASFDVSFDVAVDSAGDVYVVGAFFDSIVLFNTHTGAQERDVFVAKLASLNGAHLASTAFQGSDREQPYSVSVNDGRVVVAGQSKSMIDYGSGLKGSDDGDSAAFVVGLDAADLSHAWDRVAFTSSAPGTIDDAIATGSAVDAMGNAYVTIVSNIDGIDVGNGPAPDATYSNRRSVIVSYSKTGVYRWVQVLGGIAIGGQNGEVHNLTLDPTTGNVVLVGSFSGDEAELGAFTTPKALDTTRDVIIGVISSGGVPLGLVGFGGTAYHVGYRTVGIDVSATGNVVLGFSFTSGGAIDVGTGPVSALGTRDGFAASLGPLP